MNINLVNLIRPYHAPFQFYQSMPGLTVLMGHPYIVASLEKFFLPNVFPTFSHSYGPLPAISIKSPPFMDCSYNHFISVISGATTAQAAKEAHLPQKLHRRRRVRRRPARRRPARQRQPRAQCAGAAELHPRRRRAGCAGEGDGESCSDGWVLIAISLYP